MPAVKMPKITLKLFITIIVALLIVVPGALLFMVLVGMITVPNPDEWIEINSQFLNAIFTLLAVINHPPRILHFIRAWKIWRNPQSKYAVEESAIQKEFPFVCLTNDLPVESANNENVDSDPITTTANDNNNAATAITTTTNTTTNAATTALSNTPSTNTTANAPTQPIPLQPTSNRLTISRFLMILVLLNLNCLTQYPIAIVMWGWASDPKTRPSAVVYAFLPISFLTGTIAGGLLWWYERRWRQDLGRENEIENGGCCCNGTSSPQEIESNRL